ncbi:MAG: hypothetical protein SPL02_01180 [Bacilli bacterium]|nr:hypothetical protein [Bacilli bacterium]MDY6430921.1 hypothetical protein [Bacilli bacterium]
MSEEEKIVKKVKIVYTIELLIFVSVALVLCSLFFFEVLPITETKVKIFSILTCVGGAYMIFDFFWALYSPKHRKTAPIIDKCLLLPFGISIIGFDIFVFILGFNINFFVFKCVLSAALLYVGIIYIFQAIYHWFHPLPTLVEAALADLAERKRVEAEEEILKQKELNEETEEVEVIEEVVEEEEEEK